MGQTAKNSRKALTSEFPQITDLVRKRSSPFWCRQAVASSSWSERFRSFGKKSRMGESRSRTAGPETLPVGAPTARRARGRGADVGSVSAPLKHLACQNEFRLGQKREELRREAPLRAKHIESRSRLWRVQDGHSRLCRSRPERCCGRVDEWSSAIRSHGRWARRPDRPSSAAAERQKTTVTCSVICGQDGTVFS
jgi:hypothetical protein